MRAVRVVRRCAATGGALRPGVRGARPAPDLVPRLPSRAELAPNPVSASAAAAAETAAAAGLVPAVVHGGGFESGTAQEAATELTSARVGISVSRQFASGLALRHVSFERQSWLGVGADSHVGDRQPVDASGHGLGSQALGYGRQALGYGGRREAASSWRWRSATGCAVAGEPAVHVGSPTSFSSWRAGYLNSSRSLFCSSSLSASSSQATPESDGQSEEGGGDLSWLQRMKKAVGLGKTEKPPGEGFSLEDFANQLKQARRFGGLTQFGRGLPRGGETVVVNSLKRQETLVRTLIAHQKNGSLEFDETVKERVAANCECSVADIDSILSKYDWARRAHLKVEQLKKEGKELPKSLQEMEELMGGKWSPDATRNFAKGPPSRNSPCPCGSGKKYKRCCGKSTSDQ